MIRILFEFNGVLFSFSKLCAQTGIGTNQPNAQSVLDIQSVDKGIFPSISLTASTTFWRCFCNGQSYIIQHRYQYRVEWYVIILERNLLGKIHW